MGLRECGSEVCGLDWETHSPWILARWVWGNVDRRSGFGRRCVDRRCVGRKCVDRTEKLTHCGSDWDWEMETHSSWVGSGLRNGKETHRGFAFCARRSVGGAVRSVCGVRCEECVWELVLLWGVRCCERAQNVLCEEWKWFEVKIWTEMTLRVFWVILWSKGKSISVDWIYWFNQTLKFYGKAFPEVIWSQNKHSLSDGPRCKLVRIC